MADLLPGCKTESESEAVRGLYHIAKFFEALGKRDFLQASRRSSEASLHCDNAIIASEFLVENEP